jgi:cytochrome b
LVVLLTGSWLTGTSEDDWMGVHQWLGISVLALVLSRVAWGFVGSETARFGHFVRGRSAVVTYLRGVFSFRVEHNRVGHNPAGGWSVLLLLGLLGTQTVTGLFSNDDVLFDGPLSGWAGKGLSDVLTGVHYFLFNVLWVAIAVHIVAALAYLMFKRDNLITPMITGVKSFKEPVVAPRLCSPWWALLIALVIFSFLVWALSRVD